MDAGNLITSKEIIEKTGISRATLNNYIKMGILPKPIVRRPGPEQKGVKQIGYFPASVLERILKVKLLKQQGNSMEDIAYQFQESFPVKQKEERQEDPPAHERRHKDESTYSQSRRRVSDSEFQVTIADINSPAYLINHNFEIEWINKPAEEYIFNRNIKEIVDIESRNVFRLLLNEEMRKGVRNWNEAVLLHLTILQNRINANNLNSIYDGVTDDEVKILADLYEQKSLAARDNIYNLPVSLIKSDGTRSSFWVHSLSFREGTFFVYVPTDSVNTALLDMLSQRGRVINDLLKNKMPSLVSPHGGPVETLRVQEFEKPYGSDVILAHRLLKNDVPDTEYLLVTQDLEGGTDSLGAHGRRHPRVDACRGGGRVRGLRRDLLRRTASLHSRLRLRDGVRTRVRAALGLRGVRGCGDGFGRGLVRHRADDRRATSVVHCFR